MTTTLCTLSWKLASLNTVELIFLCKHAEDASVSTPEEEVIIYTVLLWNSFNTNTEQHQEINSTRFARNRASYYE